ncbi:MAG: Cof-type HAD-IIB family hydrolase [Clostridia bacterium]
MQYELLALDVDGTLVPIGTESISEIVKKSIKEVAAQGITVVLATGRSFRSASQIACSLGVDNYLITSNGALVQHMSNGEVLYQKNIPVNIAKEVLVAARKRGLTFDVVYPGHSVVDNDPDLIKFLREVEGVEPIICGDLECSMKEEPIKLHFLGEQEEIMQFQAELIASLGDKINVTSSYPRLLEVVNKETNKGVALAKLAEELNISMDKTMAIGDGNNDLEMLLVAGLGVAMGNAFGAVKEVADVITHTAEDDGVAYAIEKWLK